MRAYVHAQTADRLQHLEVQIKQFKQAPRDDDAEAIHDLRVAIRRLRQCLRVFSKFYPGDSWRKVRRELGGVMQACGKVRDRDIAIGLLAEAGLPAEPGLILRLQKQRRAADRDLRREVAHWKKRGLGKKFQARLEA